MRGVLDLYEGADVFKLTQIDFEECGAAFFFVPGDNHSKRSFLSSHVSNRVDVRLSIIDRLRIIEMEAQLA